MTDTELLKAGSPTGEPAFKRCSKCNLAKAPSDFSKRTASKDGLQAQCKACNSEWAKENTEARRDSWRRYRRATYMKQKYGLSIEEYWLLYAQQNEQCKICGIKGVDAGQHTVQQLPLHVDHDHQTGKVRGLLCRPCNMALGSLRDSATIGQAAVDYLLAGEEIGWCHHCGLWQRRKEAPHKILDWMRGLDPEVVQACAGGCDEAWPGGGAIAGIFTLKTSSLKPECAPRHADEHLVDQGGCSCTVTP